MDARGCSSRTRSGEQLRQVTSAIHKGRPCNPCLLCKQGNFSKYVHPKSWKNSQVLENLRACEPNVDIQLDSCICRLCREDINKLSDENFVPRWKKNSQKKRCLVSNCGQTSSKVTQLVDRDTLCALLDISDSDLDKCDTQGFPLCSEHYGAFYRKLNPFNRKCKTCNKVLDVVKARKCPNPTLVQKFLSENLEFEGTIGDEDHVCTTCYKSHLVLIKHATQSIESTDSDLRGKISQLKSEMPTLSAVQTAEQLLSYTTTLMAIHVAEILLDQGAILLPDVYDMFNHKLDELAELCKVELNPSNKISKAVLRNHISALLEHHMAYRCYAKKYGTLLYRYGGDLTFTLNKVLSTCRQHKPKNFQQTLKDTCGTLNSKIHKMIDTFVIEDGKQPHQIEDINFNEWIDKFDPDVWTALDILTQPCSASSSKVRQIRRFFCMCVLLFTTDSQCSFPIHTFLTDAIITCGGSGRLVKLLNRLGACACADTHDRYVQYRVDERKQRGIMDGYPSDCFSVVSMDNIDFVHSFGRVYSGKLQQSWHGTTIQIVLPTPKASVQVETTPTSKRTLSSRSPSSKVIDDIRSPIMKKTRRSRTGTEKACRNIFPQLPPPDNSSSVPMPIEVQSQHSLDIEKFHLTPDEQKAEAIFHVNSTDYVLSKQASEIALIDFPSFCGLLHGLKPPECSSVIYYGVLSEKCDNKETVLNVINKLHREFIVTKKKQWVLLEGDQLTYSLIVSLKEEYGNDLKWLLPTPGDWHILKNFQEVLHKIYFDGGLVELAKVCGYLPNSVGTNFDRMHAFIVETWESLYRHFLTLFMSKDSTYSEFYSEISSWLKLFPTSCDQYSASRNLKQLLEDIHEKRPTFHKDFISFLNNIAGKNPTWKLWKQYVLEDAFAYISLHLAIRTSNWDLRMSALKKMAALFTAFDRPGYQKLITNHIVDVVNMPPSVLYQLKQGGWTVSLTGRPCHSVGIDECHEMCINKDCKKYVIRPSADSIDRKAIFMPIRAKAMKQIEKQLCSEQSLNDQKEILTIYSKNSSDEKLEINIKTMVAKLSNSSLVLDNMDVDHLCYLFGQKKITSEQEHDLINFRNIGQEEFDRSVNYFILRSPSIKPPKRKKRLLTFTERKSNKRKVADIEKERKLQIECWKKRIAYCTATGQTMNKLYEQCIELPRAISTNDGEPNKGTKAIATTVYQKRYEDATPAPFLTGFPTGWTPSTVIMEGMFLINIVPWDAHKSMDDYGSFLIKQHIMPHYRNGATEVHLLFDDPKKNSLKHFERLKRDRINPVSESHVCNEFNADLPVPSNWNQGVLKCRRCKRNLVCFLSQSFLHKMKHHLHSHQKFITAGGTTEALANKAMAVQADGTPYPIPQLTCNAEEADTRVWLHAMNSSSGNVLILSPDTDVYHIGLPLVANTGLNVIVQLNKFNSRELRLLDMHALISAFASDPDLATVPPLLIPQTLQMLFVSTGCDFVSYFHGIGKTSFLSTLFEYAAFICSNDHSSESGMLTNADEETSFLSFLRLVGSAYFRKHKSVFLPSYPTPMTLFNSFAKDSNNLSEHHSKWLDEIREKVWSKIKYEEEMVPSIGALKRHWKRSRYVIGVWKQAACNAITYPPLEENGWKFDDNNVLLIDWDSSEHMLQVRNRVCLIQKGCGCKTGCITNRCKCKKNSAYCGPGCTCINCQNHPVNCLSLNILEIEEEENAICDDEDEDNNLNEQVDDIMYSVFGELDYSDDEMDLS